MTEIMTESECKEELSKTLFWDIDKAQFDMQLHSKYIIQRVLEYGNMNDWKIIRSFYGLSEIVKACKQMRSLDAVCLAFICTISNTSKEDYRCYHIKQLNHTLWNS